MSYKCEICGKGVKSGRSVSHSKKAILRKFKPNLQVRKVKIGNTVKRIYVCSKCIKSGTIQLSP